MSRFDARRFSEALAVPVELECHEALDSTNDRAWELLDEEPVVVVADLQRRGRGRRGHDWWSPAGEGLYLSVGLSAPAGPGRVPTR